MKILTILTIMISIILNTCVYAMVGETLNDPGALSSEVEMAPVAETLNTTRYAPWYLMYHLWSESESVMGRRAGEGGQMVMSIANSPLNSNLMLMGTDTSGLWRSTDAGLNWLSVNNNVNMWSVPDIAFSPKEENTVYMIQTVYGSSDSTRDKLSQTTLDGVYRSDNAGKTWKQVLEKRVYATSSANHLLAFDNEGSLYALTSEGVMKTTDGGSNWQNLGIVGTSNVCDLSVSLDGKTIIVACIDTGITVSLDGGITWQQRNNTLVPSASGIAVVNNNHWMAVFLGESAGVYESFDCGFTWTPLQYVTNGNGTAVPRAIQVAKVIGGGNPTIYLIYSSMSYPYRYSNDLGVTWKTPIVNNQDIFSKGMTGYNAEGICVDSNDPNIVYYSFGDIIYKSTNGGADFEYCSSGFSGNYVNDFVFDKDGKIYFAITDKGLAVTTAPYTTNQYPTAKMIESIGRYKNACTVDSVALDPRNSNHMIIGLGTWTEQILSQTFDGGITWSQIPWTDSGEYSTIVLHPNDANVIYTTNFTSRDAGATWVKNDISIWDVSKVNPDVLWGKNEKKICRSDDGGRTWVDLLETSDAKAIVADLFDVNVAWVGCYNGSIVKVNGNIGTTSNANNGLIEFDGNPILIQIIAQNPHNPLHLLAGGRCTVAGTKSPGLFETMDGGKTWNVVPGLPSIRTIDTIVFSKNTSEVFLGTYYGTIIYEYNKYHSWIDRHLFSKSIMVGNRLSIVGVIDKNNPTSNVYEQRTGSWADTIGTTTINGVEYDKRIFYKVDLGDIAGKNITSAKLVINERRLKTGTRFEVCMVTSNWSMSNISYRNAPIYEVIPIVSTITPGYQDAATIKEFDITNYIKSLNAGNSVANIMLKATSTSKDYPSQISSINSNTPPRIEITYMGDAVSLTADKITGSYLVEQGTVTSPQNATPILALYNGTAIEKVIIGNKQAITGSGLVSAEIDLAGLTIGVNHKLKMFVWDDFSNIIPVLKTQGVLHYLAP